MRYAIDFGTSNSLVCLAPGLGKGEVTPPIPLDPSAENPVTLRSVLYYASRNEIYFGKEAVNQFVENGFQGRLIRSFKRFLPSRNFSGTQVGSHRVMLEDILSRFLREIRERANAKTGQDVTSAVMGRPALFSEDPEFDQLAQTRLERAAKLAGFKEVEFVPEPLAAAMRYRLELQKETLVLVADFGGGTSDFTLIRLSKSAFKPSDVLAIGGVPLAGDALDGELMRHRVARCFGSEVEYTVPFGSNVLKMPKALMENLCSTAHIPLLSRRENADFLDRIKQAALGPDDKRHLEQLETLVDDQLGFPLFEAIEKAKRELTTQRETAMRYDYPGIHVDEKISQPQFEQYAQNTVERITRAMDETLAKAGVTPDQIDRVCCTGGTGQAKIIRDEVISRFGEAKIDHYLNYTSIVEGLGQWAHLGPT